MDVKKEIIYGLIGSIAIMFMVLFYRLQYANKQLEFQKSQMKKMVDTHTPSPFSLSPTQSVNIRTMPSPDLQPTVPSGITLTIEEVAKHNNAGNCWFIIENNVYDVTSYETIHPGGMDRIVAYCGQDATQAYQTKDGKGSHSAEAMRQLAGLLLGSLNSTIQLPVQ